MHLIKSDREAAQIPRAFGWVIENQLAGMAMPTRTAHLNNLFEHYGIGLVVNLLERPFFEDQIKCGPRVLHMPIKGSLIFPLAL